MYCDRIFKRKRWWKIGDSCNKFKTIKQNSTAEIVEKKSKFIAHIFYVETIEEAEEKLKEVKKKYNDARHNCFAYAIEAGNDGVAVKYNDDGEPSGTAGAPILKTVLEKGLSNILVVVTRYFGGILLGTGGLVRAYTEATNQALKNTEIVEKTRGYQAKLQIEYNNLEALKYYLKTKNINIINIEYSDTIEVEIEINEELSEEIANNYNIGNFQIISYKKIKRKFVEI